MKLNITITDESGWQQPINCESNDKMFETKILRMISAMTQIHENCHVESITMNCKITREQEEN